MGRLIANFLKRYADNKEALQKFSSDKFVDGIEKSIESINNLVELEGVLKKIISKNHLTRIL